jgi:hypothetical protein
MTEEIPQVPVEKKEQIVQKKEPLFPFKIPSQSLPDLADERRRAIYENIVKLVGFRNARRKTKSLATHYKVSERTIRQDFKKIRGMARPEDLQEKRITCIIANERVLDKALEIFETEPTMDNALKLASINKTHREELEAWEEKPKVADKVNFSGNEPAVFNIIEKSIEEIKNAKSIKPDSKPEASGDIKSS